MITAIAGGDQAPSFLERLIHSLARTGRTDALFSHRKVVARMRAALIATLRRCVAPQPGECADEARRMVHDDRQHHYGSEMQ